MEIDDYFKNVAGHGVLSTADSSGKVNAAVYARPHMIDKNTLVFIMAERFTHENLKTNPHAAYLFIESGEGYSGKRLYLTKIKEEQNDELVAEICRRCDYSFYGKDLNKYLVYFRVDKVLPLIGAG
ncbi:MAG TPA: pyridoxamine 5'-phosphate oxidase family protein [Thermodesulfobacteriota bacterium]|nr:pyridoxamine 5'-phosphate oxidase family protein [Deltaproteobacteria bacterium]HNR13408.1 pyridoxamine 5'-phosphate oxidase family protein [Thermodesulfobacteriota bacterium]HNU72276.1 pyridoxamine 5'-phosphate oxidase family protein [Thermodesulfobacteriota bacterium]